MHKIFPLTQVLRYNYWNQFGDDPIGEWLYWDLIRSTEEDLYSTFADELIMSLELGLESTYET